MSQSSEEGTLFHHLFREFRTAIERYDLIQQGDKILVGLSGGKDSLALVELLAQRRRATKSSFGLVALHVSMSNIPYQADVEYLRAFCESRGVEFLHEQTSFDPTTDQRKSPCFLCSWNRRKMLFSVAKRLECNKIALGHHKDDVLHTLLMNLTFQGSYSTMPPLLKMNKFDMTIIRPMCLIEEKDLRRLAELRAYQKQRKNCPYEEQSNRTDVKEILDRMVELNPHAKSSLWNAMSNIQTEYLPQKV